MRQKDDGSWILSPSDLVNFLGCRHATYLDLTREEYPISAGVPDPSEALLQSLGEKHEKDHLENLREQGLVVAEIPRNPAGASKPFNVEENFRARAAEAERAMRAGAEIIYQAALGAGGWSGYADFLEKVPGKSLLGDWHYEVTDTKLARRVEGKHIVQLVVYAGLLEKIQGILPGRAAIVLGDGRREQFPVSSFSSYVNHARRRLELFLADPPEDSRPEPCRHCQHCKWRKHCEDQWEHDNALTLVAGITRKQARHLEEHEIRSVGDLAALRCGRVPADIGIAGPVLERLIRQAALQEKKRLTGIDTHELLPQTGEGKGFARLPAPNAGDLFFDMEGDPLHPGGLEYLFGVFFWRDGRDEFRTFWAHDEAGEAAAFADFMGFLTGHLGAHPGAHVYHYNHYEVTALNRLAGRHATGEAELRELLRAGKFIDLYTVARESVRTSEPGLSLKNLEVFFSPGQREGDVATAMDSIVVYNRWRETGEEGLLDSIEAYNRVDCESTAGLRDWLARIRPPGTPWRGEGTIEADDAGGGNLPTGQTDGEETREHLAVREALARVDAPLLEQGRVIADMLEFHRRESSCQWREIITRESKGLHELLDDLDCLGGLKRVGRTRVDGDRRTQAYRFDPQETRIEAGDQVVDTGDFRRSWRVDRIDLEVHEVALSGKGEPVVFPEELSVGLADVVSTKTLREAIYRHARVFLEDPEARPHLGDLLARRPPQFRAGVEAPGRGGAPVLEAASRLDNSYMIVQGPPGTGKTHAAAEIIVELLAAGKKVGIAANSHKVVNNLLDRVVAFADARKVGFSGFKKCSAGVMDQEFDRTRPGGDRVRNVTTVRAKHRAEGDLFAGTAWLFASGDFDGMLDHLFIDEAGQVSLANVVAMGGSARNLVLVGDQMQLGQPTRATHPGDSGLSALDYLLRGQSTVGPEQGVFLGETRRLHPTICGYISEAFYDSRLRSHPRTAGFALAPWDLVRGLDGEGIYFAPIRHEGCSQRCEPEAVALRDLYRRLIGMTFTDGENAARPVTREDILVVSPYNLQVDHLARVLSPGARVGTVDKFQGQEAPIVLVSMASSDAEGMPRGHDFLFSPNRLNVAVSRAQCLAVVFASPELLAAPCATPDQMSLVNHLCRFTERARWLGPRTMAGEG